MGVWRGRRPTLREQTLEAKVIERLAEERSENEAKL
jgi:hypothetical protein